MQERPIPNSTAALMKGTAIFLEIFDAIPLVNIIIGPLIQGVFLFWFRLYGISFKDKSRIALMVFAFFTSWIPFVSILPTNTIAVWMIIRSNQKKFKVKAKQDAQNQAEAQQAAIRENQMEMERQEQMQAQAEEQEAQIAGRIGPSSAAANKQSRRRAA